jgi:sigma-B regulation protein RsbU (phosphoserine phosphatase)
MLRMAVRSGVDLATIAFHINEQLCDDLPRGRFITAWLAVIDADNRTLTSFSAGQGPLLYYSAEKNAFDVWQADTLPFGIMQGWDVSLRDPLRLHSGDMFAVLSDGIFEATNPESEQFGLDRVTQVLSLHRQAAPTQIVQALRAAVAEFARGVPTADDQTAIIIKCVQG